MQSRQLLNVVLTLTALALGTWLWFTTPATPQQGSMPLSKLDPEAIQHIQVQRPGKPDLVLQRSGQAWQITAPLQAPASQFRISSLIALAQAPVISTVDMAPDKAGIRQEPESVNVKLDDQLFRFGDVNPLDRSRYVEHGGSIYLIEDTLYPQLLQAADFFVEAQDATAH